MIQVVFGGPEDVESEAILRSVSSALEADTPFSREVEVQAGADLAKRLQAMGELPVGAAVITPAGDLPVGFLIHVVLRSPEEPATPAGIRTGLRNGLRRAAEWGVETLALQPLGTGAGNLDAEEAASIMVPLILDHLRDAENPRAIMIMVGTEYERDAFSRAIGPGAHPQVTPEG